MSEHSKSIKKWVFISVPLIIIGFYIFPIISYFIASSGWPEQERKIEKDLRNQVSQLPEVSIKHLMLWEGDSNVTIDIKNKGSVTFWFAGIAPRIIGISTVDGKSYSTEFICERKDSEGNRSYAYTTTLSITKDDPVGKRFDFEINTMKDLYTHFDELVRAVDSLPKFNEQELVTISDRTGTREVVKNPDKKYAFDMPYDNGLDRKIMSSLFSQSSQDPVCYMYVK